MIPLTKRERECLEAITQFQKLAGYSPSRKQISVFMGGAATAQSNAHRIVHELARKRYIKLHGKNRGQVIEVVKPS